MRPYITARVKKITRKQQIKLEGLAQVRDQWWAEAEKSGEPIICGICVQPITRREDLDSDHIKPGGFGGGRNDSPDNLQPAHKKCNIEKGSQRNFTPGKKVAPRKIREMNKREMDEYIDSLKCFCGDPKGRERPCCLVCYPRLSGWARLELSRTDLSAKMYAELLKAVELEIFTEGGRKCFNVQAVKENADQSNR